jgi:hypothetical protein
MLAALAPGNTVTSSAKSVLVILLVAIFLNTFDDVAKSTIKQFSKSHPKPIRFWQKVQVKFTKLNLEFIVDKS